MSFKKYNFYFANQTNQLRKYLVKNIYYSSFNINVCNSNMLKGCDLSLEVMVGCEKLQTYRPTLENRNQNAIKLITST